MKKMFISRKLLCYFIFLFLVLVSWTNPDHTPPEMLREVYVIALMVPTLLFAPKVMPIVITLFYVTSNYSCYVSYMPNQVILYVIFPIIALLQKLKRYSNNVPSIYVILFLYTLFGNIWGTFSLEPISACLMLIMMFVKLAPLKDSHYVHLFSFALILSSMVLGLQFIIDGKQFQENINLGEFDTRTQWMDPNYFGCVVGIGAKTALIEALLNDTLLKKTKCLFFSIFGFLCTILIINASRGALLATLCSSVILFFKSDISIKIKTATIVCFILFLYVLYIYGYFDFLLLRMEFDEGHGGTGRTDIWAIKLQSYCQLGFLDQLLGIGYQNGMRLGFGYARGFHNDYIAFLVEYGILGLIAYIGFMISFLMKAKNFWTVFSIVIYVVTTGATLEPISGGMLVYFCFLFYGKLIAKTDDFRNCSLSVY